MSTDAAPGNILPLEPDLLGHRRPLDVPPAMVLPSPVHEQPKGAGTRTHDEQRALLTRVDFDRSKPNAARIYDYLLGGKDNWQVDRDVAESLVAVIPDLRTSVKNNRDFHGRAVRAMVRMGIHQFLDIGSGLPTRANTHQIAQDATMGVGVVYVDNDELVLTHGRAILEQRASRVAMLEGDLRQPDAILKSIADQGLLDLSRPVGLLLIAVLHFLADDDQPWEVVAALRDALPVGSAVAITHSSGDAMDPGQFKNALAVYRHVMTPIHPRHEDDVARLFDGWQLQEPGLCEVSQWRPAVEGSHADVASGAVFLAGLGVKAA